MNIEASNAMSMRDEGSVGKKLKAAAGWSQDGNGDNSSGFIALPGGIRHVNGMNMYFGLQGEFLTATQADATYCWTRYVRSGADGVNRGLEYLSGGFSIRCIRN